MSKYLRCDFAEWKMKLNSPRGSFIVVVVISKLCANYFHHHKFQRPSNYGWEIQPNAELTFKPNFDALNSNIEWVSAFALSSAEGTNSTPYWTQ